jgi:hypothetical protein
VKNLWGKFIRRKNQNLNFKLTFFNFSRFYFAPDFAFNSLKVDAKPKALNTPLVAKQQVAKAQVKGSVSKKGCLVRNYLPCLKTKNPFQRLPLCLAQSF